MRITCRSSGGRRPEVRKRSKTTGMTPMMQCQGVIHDRQVAKAAQENPTAGSRGGTTVPFEDPFPRVGIGCLPARCRHGSPRPPAANEYLPRFYCKNFLAALCNEPIDSWHGVGPASLGSWRQDRGRQRHAKKAAQGNFGRSGRILRLGAAAGMRKRRPRGAPEGRRSFGGKKAASKRKECRGPKRGMPRFVRQAGAKSPSRALRAHCRRTRQERRAFGGPDPAGLQTRAIFPQPRQAALNFGQPRPPRRLCPPSSTLT